MTADSSVLPVRLLSVGDTAWTVEFGSIIDPAIHGRVLGFCSLLDTLSGDGRLDGVVEWVPTFRSVTVHFNPEQADAMALHDRLGELATKSGILSAAGCRWHIPVCFDAECAPDLADVAQAKGMTPEAVVQLLTDSVFSVYMLGFLPGFPYLGGVPEVLDMPRLASPRKVVPSRSIAIAGRMCAAYPWESPGGWRLLGRTPIRLFDAANARRPALLAPGDQVVWEAIDSASYAELEHACAAGDFDLSSLMREGGA
ncbi:5-oxoprolinase subunit PxpB [Dechloromonas sp. ZY10]|uniref:5-oxoprolinase subunit PxpB n=1 Tax=Dechloromonas aquae TaxID=2664436 RepID=UPI00352869C7